MKIAVIAMLLGVCGIVAAQPRLSPSIEADAEYLLTTTDFMNAQFGMGVEAVDVKPASLTVRTTGAEFVFEPGKGLLHLRQRLGKVREAAVVTFPRGALDGLKVTRQGTGAVLLTSARGRITMRINGDSLLMLKTAGALDLSYKVGFTPGSMHECGRDYLWLDEYGAVGSFVAAGPAGAKASHDDLTARYGLNAGQYFWLSVGPPRPYDWEASFKDRVVWHWSHETGYPTDAQIADWSHYGNMLLQQAEVMLWKDWSLRFIPRNGVAEFERVNNTCRKYGMRNYVYTSPLYFLTGTGLEDKAMNSFDHFAETGFSPGDLRGLNWPIFLSEITKVMREYKPQGLYFDGIYGNVVRTYLITRKAREVVGDKGILEFHATFSPPGGGVYLPQVDTYFTFILRGEGVQYLYENPDYLRYFVSTYNISNSIGVLCNNNDYKLDQAYIDKLLDNNIRLHFIAGWENDYRKAVFENLYWPQLNDALKARVARECAQREAAAGKQWAAMEQADKQGVAGLKVGFTEGFADPGFKVDGPKPTDGKPEINAPANPHYVTLPDGWRAYFSPNSDASLSAAGGVLSISARQNTCAYLERELPGDVAAVECKIRAEGGAGMSWGPGLQLRTPHSKCRINVRDEGRLGVDGAAGQMLIDDYPAAQWYWLRLRLVGPFLFYEASRDGKTWKRLASEVVEEGGPRWLLVGKIADAGTNTEYPDLGGRGTSQIAEVKVYER